MIFLFCFQHLAFVSISRVVRCCKGCPSRDFADISGGGPRARVRGRGGPRGGPGGGPPRGGPKAFFMRGGCRRKINFSGGAPARWTRARGPPPEMSANSEPGGRWRIQQLKPSILIYYHFYFIFYLT